MKKGKSGGHATKEKAKAGAHKPSGINTPAMPAKVPQVEAKTRYGKPSQTQKM